MAILAMNKVMKNRNYIPLSTIIAITYWLADALIEWHSHEGHTFTLIPSDIYELCLKILIFLLLVGFGIYTNYFTKMFIAQEEEKKKVYKNTANEAKKILKEFLHDVHYFESEAERIGGFDGKTMQHLEDALRKTEVKVDNLINAGDLTMENIRHSVKK